MLLCVSTTLGARSIDKNQSVLALKENPGSRGHRVEGAEYSTGYRGDSQERPLEKPELEG